MEKDSINLSEKSKAETLLPGKKLRTLGANRCTDRELLAIIFNTGTRGQNAMQIADDLLSKFGTFYSLQGKTLAEIMEIEGIGPVKATQLAAIFELFRRLIRQTEAEM